MPKSEDAAPVANITDGKENRNCAHDALCAMEGSFAGKQGEKAGNPAKDCLTEERLQDMLAESQAEIERTKSELATVTGRLSEAQSTVSRILEAKQDSQKCLKESFDRAEQQAQMERAKRLEYERELYQLKAKSATFCDEIQNLRLQLNAAERCSAGSAAQEISQAMDELSAAMQEVAKLQANSVKMQSEVVLLEAELKKERAQHLATSQQLEIAQSTPGDYKANKKDLDARLTECQRKLDEALTAKRHVVAQLNTNQHKSFEMLEILEKTREELAAAKSRALEQENRAHKMAIRLAEAKTAGGNVEAELQSCLEKFANYKQDLDDLKENSVPLNRHRQCVNELTNLKAGFEALELENAMKAALLRTEKEERAKEVQELNSCLETARREVQKLQEELELSRIQHAVELKVTKRVADMDEDSLKQDLENSQRFAQEAKVRLQSLQDEVMAYKMREVERDLRLEETKKKLEYEQRRGKRLEQQASTHEMLRSELENYKEIIAKLRLPNGISGDDILGSRTSSSGGVHSDDNAGSTNETGGARAAQEELAAPEELPVFKKKSRQVLRSAPPPSEATAAAEMGHRLELETLACDDRGDSQLQVTRLFRKSSCSSSPLPAASLTLKEGTENKDVTDPKLQAAIDVIRKISASSGSEGHANETEDKEPLAQFATLESSHNISTTISGSGSCCTTPVNIPRERITMQEALRRGIVKPSDLADVEASSPGPSDRFLPSLVKPLGVKLVVQPNESVASIIKDTESFSKNLSPGLSHLEIRPKGAKLCSPADKKRILRSRILEC